VTKGSNWGERRAALEVQVDVKVAGAAKLDVQVQYA